MTEDVIERLARIVLDFGTNDHSFIMRACSDAAAELWAQRRDIQKSRSPSIPTSDSTEPVVPMGNSGNNGARDTLGAARAFLENPQDGNGADFITVGDLKAICRALIRTNSGEEATDSDLAPASREREQIMKLLCCSEGCLRPEDCWAFTTRWGWLARKSQCHAIWKWSEQRCAAATNARIAELEADIDQFWKIANSLFHNCPIEPDGTLRPNQLGLERFNELSEHTYRGAGRSGKSAPGRTR